VAGLVVVAALLVGRVRHRMRGQLEPTALGRLAEG
jgi:hypothetical protein